MNSILLVISSVCIVLAKGQDYPPCPPGFDLPDVCVEECASDADCRIGNFCCRNSSCQLFCLPRPKAGTCPTPQQNQVGGRTCRTDVDCDGKQKCCHDFCTDPIDC